MSMRDRLIDRVVLQLLGADNVWWRARDIVDARCLQLDHVWRESCTLRQCRYCGRREVRDYDERTYAKGPWRPEVPDGIV